MDRRKSLTLAIPERTAEKLAALAALEYRAPRQQAAVLLIEAVERAEAARDVGKVPA